MTDKLEQWIRDTLEREFNACELEIINESHLHIGHPGNNGGSHFRIHIVSSVFSGKSLVEQHRLVHAALKDKLGNEIHAIHLVTSVP